MLKRREKNYDYSISPLEYKNGKKKLYPVDEYKISSIINFALLIKNYKLALKNLKWVYLNTTPYKRPFILNIEAAFIWFKNNRFNEAENILQIEFAQQPRYRNLFTSGPLTGATNQDGRFSFLDYIETEISLGRKILSNPNYADFVEWGKKNFYYL